MDGRHRAVLIKKEVDLGDAQSKYSLQNSQRTNWKRKHPTRSIVKIVKRIKSVLSHYSYPTLNWIPDTTYWNI